MIVLPFGFLDKFKSVAISNWKVLAEYLDVFHGFIQVVVDMLLDDQDCLVSI